MNSGAILLAVMTAVTVVDMAIAVYFRALADRVESGDAVSTTIDPSRTRKMVRLMLINAPIIWLIIALVSFGIIPSGIDPIKF
jgi:hypothetical protein